MDPTDRRRILFIAVLIAALAVALLALAGTPRERGLYLNSALLAAGTLAVSLPIGVFLAFCLSRTDLPGRRLLGLLIVIMLFMPLYVQTAAWLEGFGAVGWHTRVLSVETPLITGWPGAIWLHAVAAIPWVTVITAAAMCGVEPQLEEAVLLDGGPGQVFWHVTLRRSLPAILAAALWVAVWTAGEITVTDVLVIRTYAEEVFQGFATGQTLQEVTVGMLPTLAMVTLLVLATLFVCRGILAVDPRAAARPRFVFRWGRWRPAALLVVGGIVILLAGVPLLNLVINVGIVVREQDGEIVRTWSAASGIHNLLNNVWDRRSELSWSVVTSAAAATAALVFAIALAWPARRQARWQWPALLLIALCLAMPGPLIGLSLRWLFDLVDWRPWNFLIDNSILAPATALTIRALPLCALVVYLGLRSVPEKTLEAAAVEGAGSLRQLFLVALPQCPAALLCGWLVAFAVAMGDLSASYLVMPPGFSTAAKRIFEDIHYGDSDEIAGITLAMIALTGLIAVLATVVFRRQQRRQG